MIANMITPVLDRLEINIKEILGVNSRVFRLAPSITVASEECPFSVVRWGRLLKPIPRDYAGKVVISREFSIDLFVKPLTNTVDIDNLGAEALSLVDPYVHLFQNYFIENHPRLDTDGTYQTKLGNLQWLFEDILMLPDSGLVKQVGAGGDLYSGITFPLQIDLYQITHRSS